MAEDRKKFRQKVGARIRMAREAAGLDRDQLAARLGISRFMISSYERGSRGFPPELYPALCLILDRPVTYFLGMKAAPGFSPDASTVATLFDKLASEQNRYAVMQIIQGLVQAEAEYRAAKRSASAASPDAAAGRPAQQTTEQHAVP